jgi:hypothetical protein
MHPHHGNRSVGNGCVQNSVCRREMTTTEVPCDCHEVNISLPVTAIVYIASQPFVDVYEPCVGFAHGTIFAQLDKPWLAGGCRYGK